MRRSAALILLAIVATGPAVRAQEERPSGSSVSALDNVFTPEMIRIAPGETVGWTIDGRSPHTVDADDGSWSSGNLDPGATFEQRFDEPGVYRYFCRYHGRRGGVGMAGTIVVGDAPLPGGASPGREPVPAGPADTVRVPGDAPTIQTAVDRARPGGLVLIAPGVYREAVVVTTPYLTIRGIDGTETVLDGGSRLANGIHVIEADGVSIENLTARRYLLNGFSWSGVYGYRGTHLTAHANGEHGVFAFESRFGRIEHSYASGSPDAGFSIAACYPCDAVITDVLAEHNALGYSGTNAGGNLAIVNSEWRDNLAGIVPNTLDSEPFAPQRGAVIAGNHVHHNNSTTIGAATDFGSIPFGIGIAVAGGRDDRIVGNLVEDQATYGIGIGPLLDVNLWPSSGNRVEGNIVRRSGRADLALAAPAGGGDCFERNEAWSSQPAAVDVLFPCEGIRPFPLGGGSLAPTINAFSRYLDPPGGSSPRGDWRDQPPPAALPSMPGDPGAAPPDPAIPDDVVPGPYRIRPVSEIRSAGGPAVGKEVSLMGVPLATSWWSLLLGLYGYILPFVLYASWVAVAMWDLIRRETEPTSTRIGWIAVVLLIPFVGPLLYYAMGRSPIPASMRLALTAGGALAYLVFVGLGVVLGG